MQFHDFATVSRKNKTRGTNTSVDRIASSSHAAVEPARACYCAGSDTKRRHRNRDVDTDVRDLRVGVMYPLITVRVRHRREFHDQPRLPADRRDFAGNTVRQIRVDDQVAARGIGSSEATFRGTLLTPIRDTSVRLRSVVVPSAEGF